MSVVIKITDPVTCEWIRIRSLADFLEAHGNVQEQIIANYLDAFLELLRGSSDVEPWRVGALDKLFSAQCVGNDILVDAALNILDGAQSEEEALEIVNKSLEKTKERLVSTAPTESPTADNHSEDMPENCVRADPGGWKPALGYVWVSKKRDDYRVKWYPGKVYDEGLYPNVISDETEGMWVPRPGYVWKGTKNDVPRGKKQVKRVVWCPGRSHRDDGLKNILSATVEGKWIPDGGYIWRKSAFTKELKKTAVIGDYEEYKAEFPLSYYIDNLKNGEILYRELPDIVRKFLKTMREPKTLDEIYDGGLLPPSWQPGLPMPGHPHVLASKWEDWGLESGYEWVEPDVDGDFRVRKIRTSDNDNEGFLS